MNTIVTRLNIDVVLEANSESFSDLIKNRPSCINIHSALCDKPREVVLVKNSNHPAVDGIEELMSSSIQKQWHANSNVSSRDRIRCLKVSNILRTLHVSRIDLWVLDVEGAELPVLKVRHHD